MVTYFLSLYWACTTSHDCFTLPTNTETDGWVFLFFLNYFHIWLNKVHKFSVVAQQTGEYKDICIEPHIYFLIRKYMSHHPKWIAIVTQAVCNLD